MLENYNIRTDLALETRERFVSDHVEIPGVSVEETYDEEREIRTTRVVVETENGAKMMGKPVGTYLTIEAPNMAVPDEDYHREISKKLAEDIKELVPERKEEVSVLVVGLGNREVTPDALGPYVADHLHVTRHIVKEYGKYAMGKDQVYLVSAVVPGVTGQTGMETLEIVKGVVEETEPDFVVAIDALAARNSKRLNRTIQITDTGIEPGAGVGNRRKELTKKTLGIPVVAIGVPTVVDAATIISDHLEHVLEKQGYSEEEIERFIYEILTEETTDVMVTPKNIDESVNQISKDLAKVLNHCFQKRDNYGNSSISFYEKEDMKRE